MDIEVAWWFTLAAGLPLLVWLVWSWNELRYVVPVKARSGVSKLPPGHMGLPFIGEMLSFIWYFKFLRRPDDFIRSKQRRYGDEVGIYRTHLFGSPAIIASSPAFNKVVLQSEASFPSGWPSPELMGSNSLAVLHGQAHHKIKIFVTNAINHPNALKRIALLVQPRLVSSLRSWTEKGSVIAYEEVKKVVFQNIGKLFAGLEPGNALDNLEDYFRGLVKGMNAFPLHLPGSAYTHAFECHKKLTAIFRVELEKRKQSRNGNEREKDLMDGLIEMRNEEGKQLDDDEVLDNIVGLVLGGYESTVIASMWAFYYLAKYPDVLSRLREENMAMVKSREDDDLITSEEALKLKYTSKVVEEVVRLANIAPFLFRSVAKDFDFRGYRIPKGWKVLNWIRFLHTDPKNFDDPLSFNPDRWNEPSKPGTYQAFGSGSRICAGNNLARMQLAILLHHLAVGYKWDLVNPNAPIAYLPHPKPVDGVEINFSRL